MKRFFLKPDGRDRPDEGRLVAPPGADVASRAQAAGAVRLFAAMLHRLYVASRDGRLLAEADVEYWAGRFVQQHVRFWTARTFEGYLADPLAAERRMLERQADARLRRGLVALNFSVTRPGAPRSIARFTIGLN